MIKQNTKISFASRPLLLLSKVFLPSVQTHLFPHGIYVSDKEMYALEGDRHKINPTDLNFRSVGSHATRLRNTTVAYVRRQLWMRACTVSIYLSIAVTGAYQISLGGIHKTESAFNGATSWFHHDSQPAVSSTDSPAQPATSETPVQPGLSAADKESRKALILKQLKVIQANLASGSMTQQTFDLYKAQLKQQYDTLK